MPKKVTDGLVVGKKATVKPTEVKEPSSTKKTTVAKAKVVKQPVKQEAKAVGKTKQAVKPVKAVAKAEVKVKAPLKESTSLPWSETSNLNDVATVGTEKTVAKVTMSQVRQGLATLNPGVVTPKLPVFKTK